MGYRSNILTGLAFLLLVYLGDANTDTNETQHQHYFCETEGFFLDPYGDGCKEHYQCMYLSDHWFYHLHNCSNDEVFDSDSSDCVTGACDLPSTTTTSTTTTTIPTTTRVTTTPKPTTTSVPTKTTTRVTTTPKPTTTSVPTTTTTRVTTTPKPTTTSVPTTTTTRPPATLTTTTTTRPTTTTTRATTTKKPSTTTRPTTTKKPSEFQCPASGNFGDPINCNIYHACVSSGTGFIDYIMPCPSGLVYCSPGDYCGYTWNCPSIPCLNQN